MARLFLRLYLPGFDPSQKDEIIEREPPATTATGALLPLDHVLQNGDSFEARTEFARPQMLWLLVKAARDYIAATSAR